MEKEAKLDKQAYDILAKYIGKNPRDSNTSRMKQALIKFTIKELENRRPTDILDANGNMIHFGDTLRFTDKKEWYGSNYYTSILLGKITEEQAAKEIEELPYEERIVKSVQDYDWLLSSEIQQYWEIV